MTTEQEARWNWLMSNVSDEDDSYDDEINLLLKHVGNDALRDRYDAEAKLARMGVVRGKMYDAHQDSNVHSASVFARIAANHPEIVNGAILTQHGIMFTTLESQAAFSTAWRKETYG